MSEKKFALFTVTPDGDFNPEQYWWFLSGTIKSYAHYPIHKNYFLPAKFFGWFAQYARKANLSFKIKPYDGPFKVKSTTITAMQAAIKKREEHITTLPDLAATFSNLQQATVSASDAASALEKVFKTNEVFKSNKLR